VAAPVQPPARAPESLEFSITARSDLPTAASTAVPFTQTVEAVVAGLRPSLAACLRSLGAPARRTVRIIIDDDGSMRTRPPQEYVLSGRDAACVEGVLRAATVEPAPPRAMPYDLRVDVDAAR
jgi:hypothetical protein